MVKRKLQVGLKLWSVDIDVIDAAAALHGSGLFDFVELYAVPGTYDGMIKKWRSLNTEYVIHCPHSAHGFNLAAKDSAGSNLSKFEEVRRFADTLSADVIVVHPGHSGTLGETIRQLRTISDMRIHIENKPYRGTKEEQCVGVRPEEITEILENSPVGGFVLDFSHAVCAANSLGFLPDDILREFLSLSPALFHLSDAPSDVTKDVHLNLGKGSLDLRKFISVIPDGGKITIETPREKSGELRDFVGDAEFLKGLIPA